MPGFHHSVAVLPLVDNQSARTSGHFIPISMYTELRRLQHFRSHLQRQR